MRLSRILGAATVGYGAAVIVSPALLAKPTGLTGRSGETSEQVDVLVRAVGARDVASGLAMMLAPPGRALEWALTLRVLSDGSDAVLFGAAAPTSTARNKTVAGAGGWALLNLLALGRERRGRA